VPCCSQKALSRMARCLGQRCSSRTSAAQGVEGRLRTLLTGFIVVGISYKEAEYRTDSPAQRAFYLSHRNPETTGGPRPIIRNLVRECAPQPIFAILISSKACTVIICGRRRWPRFTDGNRFSFCASSLCLAHISNPRTSVELEQRVDGEMYCAPLREPLNTRCIIVKLTVPWNNPTRRSRVEWGI
jgi:hypothetical protein